MFLYYWFIWSIIIEDNCTIRGYVVKYILFICLVGLGLFKIIKPDVYWRLEHYFDVKNGEPTEFAIDEIKSIGIGGIIIAFILLLLL